MAAAPSNYAPHEQKHLLALSSLRFLAAFHVVLFHAFAWDQQLEADHWWERAWAQFCGHGFAAVGFFFALSGFILSYNYPARRLSALRPFYVARFARVYPVYALGALASLPFFAVRVWKGHSYLSGVAELLLATTLLQAWVPTLWFAVNTPGWSLSVEAFFYAVFPGFSRWLRARANTPPRAIAALSFLYLAALMPALAGTYLSSTGMPLQDKSTLADALRYLPILALPEFAFGIVLGHMFVSGMVQARIVRLLMGPALVALIAALVTDWVPYMVLHNGGLLPLFGVVILACAHGSLLPSLLTRRWLVRLGEASYSLYILHMPIYIALKIAIERSGFDPRVWWAFAVVAMSAVTSSVVVFKWFEEPARRRILDAYKRAQLS